MASLCKTCASVMASTFLYDEFGEKLNSSLTAFLLGITSHEV